METWIYVTGLCRNACSCKSFLLMVFSVISCCSTRIRVEFCGLELDTVSVTANCGAAGPEILRISAAESWQVS